MKDFLFIFLGLSLLTDQGDSVCPHSYKLWKDKCIKAFDRKETWDTSNIICTKQGRLLELWQHDYNKTEVRQLIRDNIKSAEIWVGARKQKTWFWSDDGTTSQDLWPVSQKFWGPSEPNGGRNEDRISLFRDSNFTWNDEAATPRHPNDPYKALCSCRNCDYRNTNYDPLFELNNNWYIISNIRSGIDWTEAWHDCQQFNAKLVKVDTRELQLRLQAALPNRGNFHYWTAGYWSKGDKLFWNAVKVPPTVNTTQSSAAVLQTSGLASTKTASQPLNTSASNAASTACPYTAVVWKDKCIEAYLQLSTWTESASICTSENATLLELWQHNYTYSDITGLLTLLNTSDMWVGARKQKSWFWSEDSTTVSKDTARILKKFWAPGEPTSRTLTSEDRIGLSSLHGYLWNDEARYKSDAGGVSYKPICYCKNCAHIPNTIYLLSLDDYDYFTIAGAAITWDIAWNKCQGYNAKLVRIDSEALQLKLQRELPKHRHYNYWTAGYWNKQSKYSWNSGTEVSDVDVGWHTPGDQELCVALTASNLRPFVANKCNQKKQFFCEFERSAIASSTQTTHQQKLSSTEQTNSQTNTTEAMLGNGSQPENRVDLNSGETTADQYLTSTTGIIMLVISSALFLALLGLAAVLLRRHFGRTASQSVTPKSNMSFDGNRRQALRRPSSAPIPKPALQLNSWLKS